VTALLSPVVIAKGGPPDTLWETAVRRSTPIALFAVLALSLAGCGNAAASPPPVPFTPFYVGAYRPGNDVMHYVEYSDDPAVARELCETVLREAEGEADCLASPETGTWVDVTDQCGWALPYGPTWAPSRAAHPCSSLAVQGDDS
jgi:hypothetical protein